MALPVPVRPLPKQTFERVLESLKYGEPPSASDTCSASYCNEFQAVITGTLLFCYNCRYCLGDVRPLCRHISSVSPVFSGLVRRAGQDLERESSERIFYRPVSCLIGDGDLVISEDVQETSRGNIPFAACVSGVPLPQELTLTEKFAQGTGKSKYSELSNILHRRAVKHPTLQQLPAGNDTTELALSVGSIDGQRKRLKLQEASLAQQDILQFGKRIAAAASHNQSLRSPMEFEPPMPVFAPHHFTVDMIMVQPLELLGSLKLPETFIKHQEVQASTEGKAFLERMNMAAMFQTVARSLVSDHEVTVAQLQALLKAAFE